MSNTIKLKRGSGSDPSASDLSVGELAIRTDSGKIFTKKDNGSVAEISGGGGIDDGDKGDITVSNGGDTFTIDSGVVTSAKIATSGVESNNIQNLAISTAKIQDDAITVDKLANPAVNTVALYDNAVTTAKILDGNVTSAKIADGAIVNADINASAAIAGSKISPTFTSNVEISNTYPSLTFTDTNHNSDYRITNNDGQLIIYDITNSAHRLNINADGHVDILGNLDVGAGIDVTGNVEITSGDVLITDQHPSIRFTDTDAPSGYGHVGVNNTSGSLVLRSDDGNALSGTFMGFEIDGSPKMRLDSTGLGIGTNSPSQKLDVVGNISVSGTVDGVDIAARNTLFGGLTSSSGVLTNGVTATTQSAGNNTTRVATTAFVSTAISNLINNAPSALDTLKELSDALGSDANFSTTVTNSIATKLPLAGGTLTGNVLHNDGVKALFGTGSDLEIYHASDNSYIDQTGTGHLFIRGNGTNGVLIRAKAGENGVAVHSDGDVSLYYDGNERLQTLTGGVEIFGNITVSGNVDGRDVATDGSKLDGIESGATADQTASEILTLLKTVDGAGSGLDADTLDGISSASFVRSDASDTLTGATYTLSSTTDQKIILSGSSNPYIRFKEGTTNKAYVQWAASGYLQLVNEETSEALRIKSGSNGLVFLETGTERIVYHDGNLTVGDGGLTQNNFTNTLKSKLDGIASGATNVTNTNQLTNGAGYITATLTNEQVQDIVGAMVSSNTESGISVTYADNGGSAGKLNFSVTSQTDNNFTNADHSKLDGIESGATADQSNSEIKTAYEANSNTNAFTDALLSKLNGIAASATNVTNNNQLTNGAGYITATLTNEQVQDIVGGMVTGNTETGITVTYQDGDGTLDFVVGTLNQDTTGNAASADTVDITGTNSNTNYYPLFGTEGSGATVYNDLSGNLKYNPSTNVLTSVSFAGALTGNVTGNVSGSSGSCTGNAATATTLATARNIAGVSFDGSANISLNNNAITNGAGYLTSVGTSNITDGAVTNAKIAAGAVGGTSLGSNAVSTVKIADDAITTAKIADGAVNTDRIAGSAVNSTRLADNAVTTSKITNNSVTNAKINSMAASKLTGALPAIDGSNLTGISAGATGGGSDQIFYENGQTVTTNYTITNGKNAMAAGPITINSGVTVTVGSGETLTIV